MIKIELNEVTIVFLIQFWDQNTCIEKVLYDEKEFYERTNKWIEKEKGPFVRPVHDPDIKCSSYTKECEAPPTIFPEDPENVKYQIKVSGADINENLECEEECEEECRSKDIKRETLKYWVDKISTWCTTYPLTEIVLWSKNIEKLYIINPHGKNNDHRGSDHCQIALPFEQILKIELPINLQDLYSALYTLRSHKWDRNYELYTGCKVNLKEEKVVLKFDHGS